MTPQGKARFDPRVSHSPVECLTTKPPRRCQAAQYVTLHHEMSRNVPNGRFPVCTFSESKFYAIYNGEDHFQITGLVAELHVSEHGGTTFGTSEKTCFKC